MTKKSMSWVQAALMFVWMTTVTFGLTLAFYPTLRHQLGSFHSTLWQIAVPSDLVAIAVFVIAARFVINLGLTGRNCANLETHQNS